MSNLVVMNESRWIAYDSAYRLSSFRRLSFIAIVFYNFGANNCFVHAAVAHAGKSVTMDSMNRDGFLSPLSARNGTRTVLKMES